MSTAGTAGDGSNAPVGAVTELLSAHFSADGSQEVEIPQEEETEGLESSNQDAEEQLELELDAENAEEGDEQAQEAAGDDEIKTFTELAEMLELDPSALYGLTYPMPDGMAPVSLSEMKDAYVKLNRMPEGSVEGAQDLQKQKQEFDQYVQQQQQAMQAQMQVPQQFQQIDTQLANIQMAAKNTDWAKLEKQDPGDAALQRQKLNEAFQALSAQKGQMQQQMQMQQQQSMAQFAQEQVSDLLDAHPEWKEAPAESIKGAWDEVIEYGKQFGLTDAEMRTLPNSKVFRMLHAAATQSKLSSTDVKGKRLTRKSAPALRASSVRKAAGGRRAKLDNIIKRGTSSSDIRDKTAAVSALLNS